MSAIKLSTPSSGSISLSPENTASNLTITVPAVTGTMLTTASTFAGTGPAFSAYANAAQPLTANTFTKVVLNVESFDTNNNFDSVTNYRFTPTVAGYYLVNGYVSNGSVVTIIPFIYKNGSAIATGSISQGSSANGSNGSCVSDLIFMNGSTDYIELYVISIGSSSNTGAGLAGTKMSAVMVRAA